MKTCKNLFKAQSPLVSTRLRGFQGTLNHRNSGLSSDSEFESDTDAPAEPVHVSKETKQPQTFLGSTTNKNNDRLLNNNIVILTIPQKQIQEDSNPSSLSNNQDLPTLDSHVNTLEGTNKEADSKKDTEVFQSSELSKLARNSKDLSSNTTVVAK